jgi:hypothetical protein
MNKERLLNVAKALRESPNPDLFTMARYGFDCGTPACALGHYAARPDLQDFFKLKQNGMLVLTENDEVPYGEDEMEHFGIDEKQAAELFGTEGCGNAQTPIEAAEYIEQFVAYA